MIGHLFKWGNPRQDYILDEVSNYLGVSIHPSSPGAKDRIFLGSVDSKERKVRGGSALVLILPVSNGALPEPIIEGYFSWKDLQIPYFGKACADVDGEPFLSDVNGNPLITIKQQNDRTTSTIGFDILNPIYFFLCGLEELDAVTYDEFGRFPHSSSTLFKENLMHTPVVTAYMDILGELFKRVHRMIGKTFYRVWPWPNGYDFALGLSHDTDEIERFTLKKCAYSLLKREIPQTLESFKGTFKQLEKNDYWTFSKIMKMEKKYNVRSTFFFSGLTDDERSSRPMKERMGKELAYTVSDPSIKKLYREIAGMGWEVGLHSSFTSNNAPSTLKKEKDIISGIIEKDVGGVRQHFLRFKLRDFFLALEEAGFRYDSSVGYSSHSGFRAGSCYPYLFFDDRSRKRGNIMEIPLAIMEVTLSEKKSVSPSRISNAALGIIDIIKRFNGGSAILWHNNRYFDKEYSGWGKAYEMVLKKAVVDNGYLASLEDIRNWVEVRKNVVIKEAGSVLKVKTTMPVSGLTIEICPDTDNIDEYEPTAPGIHVSKRKKDSLLLTIVEIRGKGAVSIPLP